MKVIDRVKANQGFINYGLEGNNSGVRHKAEAEFWQVKDVKDGLCWNSWQYSSLEDALSEHPDAKLRHI